MQTNHWTPKKEEEKRRRRNKQTNKTKNGCILINIWENHNFSTGTVAQKNTTWHNLIQG